MEDPQLIRRPEPIPSVGFSRDLPAEAILDGVPVSWSYQHKVGIGLIVAKRSLRNNARVGPPLDQEYVNEYAAALKRGEALPSMVAYLEKDGTYTLAGGNHRLPAYILAGVTAVDLYVIICDDQALRALIPPLLNRYHGRPVRPGERVQQAIAWMRQFNKSVRQTALAYGIPDSTLHHELREQARDERNAGLGIRAGQISRRVERRLNIIANDGPYKAAHELTVDARLNTQEAGDLAKAIADQHSEEGQQAVLDDWKARDDIQARIAERRKLPNMQQPLSERIRSQIFTFLNGAANKLAQYPSRAQSGLTQDSEYQRAIEVSDRIAARLAAMATEPAEPA